MNFYSKILLEFLLNRTPDLKGQIYWVVKLMVCTFILYIVITPDKLLVAADFDGQKIS